MNPEAIAFWVLGTIAVIGAIGVVAARKAVYSAMCLATTMIALAIIYVAQEALFLGVVQIVVYTGAVMMLFLFVLMLTSAWTRPSPWWKPFAGRIAGILAGLGFGVLLIAAIGTVSTSGFTGLTEANKDDDVEGLARLVFTRNLWAFELTSALLIIADCWTPSMLCAPGRAVGRRKTQRELAVERFRNGAAPLIAKPGRVRAGLCCSTFPPLLPDGSEEPSSVNETLRSDRLNATAREPGELPVPLGAAVLRRRLRQVLLRRNAIVMFMCVELMLNAANLAFVASPGCAAISRARWSRSSPWWSPCEVVVGLAIILTVFRTRHSADVDESSLLRHDWGQLI